MANLQFFSCILLALCTLSSSANDFISIDCGSSGSYEDENGITWTGDGEYVKTGESHSVKPSDSYDSRVTGTLRVFTNKRKNCYEVGPVKTGRVLVRATFYYGNYDGKSSPPEFYLIIDGNYWAIVRNSGPTPSRSEVIYVSTKESISVCIVQDEDQKGLFPYISALEVRSLGPFMYGGFDDTYPLFTRSRLDYGTNATLIRIISGYGLSGLLPDFSSMDALHTINLSNNSLRGNIPDFFGDLPNLKILNLENNKFNGTIPASLLTKKDLILRVGGNPELLCPSNTSVSCQQGVPAGGPVPAANSSMSKKNTEKNILQMLFTIIPSIILLHFNY